MKLKQSVEGRPYAPFLSMCGNCFLWSTYGLLFRDPTIILTNLVGLILSIYYVYTYFSVAKLSERVLFFFFLPSFHVCPPVVSPTPRAVCCYSSPVNSTHLVMLYAVVCVCARATRHS
jgi:hypothetical protein